MVCTYCIIIYLFRQTQKYIIETYCPTITIVLMSVVSFFIPPEVYPGRMGMLVVLILVLVNILLRVLETSPHKSGICGLVQWVFICLVMVSQNMFPDIRIGLLLECVKLISFYFKFSRYLHKTVYPFS